jgi:hypothetical protein
VHLRRQGDLVVAERDRLADQINRRLKEIDGRLFLEKQIRLRDQKPCWHVMFVGSLDREPDVLFEWSGPDGAPLELSWSVYDRVVAGRLDRSPRAKLAQREAEAANQRKRDGMEAWAQNEHEQIAREVVPMRSPMHSALLPRGVYLRMHRDRMRARGRKV